MDNRVLYVLLILASELTATLVFWLLSKLNDEGGRKNRIDFISIVKGLSERFFIAFTLTIGLPQALTFFAALKIATRIQNDHKVSNDFYLLGNLLSVILGIVYSQLYSNLIL
ncbi:MAG: hypothetical protein AAGF85_11290 [Bacteroidota bacterium]